MANSPTGDSVIGRVVRLLNAFDRQQPSMTLSGLAHRASLPLTTAHRLVEELVKYGLIERDPDGQLRVGLRLWELAARGSRALTLREIALPFIKGRSGRSTPVHHTGDSGPRVRPLPGAPFGTGFSSGKRLGRGAHRAAGTRPFHVLRIGAAGLLPLRASGRSSRPHC